MSSGSDVGQKTWLCQAGTGLAGFQCHEIIMLQNTKNLYKCVLPPLWQPFGKGPHMNVMVMYTHTFDHSVYFQETASKGTYTGFINKMQWQQWQPFVIYYMFGVLNVDNETLMVLEISPNTPL